MARRFQSKTVFQGSRRANRPEGAQSVRIIGGEFRGRKLKYSGDPRTRPMKDRVREALFNLLRDDLQGRVAIDLFAGTGALGLEAVSRGASRAILLEQHTPTAAIIRENVAMLHAQDRTEVLVADAFAWVAQCTASDPTPWLVFCSPPFAFYTERHAEMINLVRGIIDHAPPDSTLMVEAEQSFDFGLLSSPDGWQIRAYPPITLGIYRCPTV